jgi:hypothetical protein
MGRDVIVSGVPRITVHEYVNARKSSGDGQGRNALYQVYTNLKNMMSLTGKILSL